VIGWWSTYTEVDAIPGEARITDRRAMSSVTCDNFATGLINSTHLNSFNPVRQESHMQNLISKAGTSL